MPPKQDPRDPATTSWILPSALALDDKSLYDMVTKTGSAAGSQDKQMAIEVEVLKEEMKSMKLNGDDSERTTVGRWHD